MAPVVDKNMVIMKNKKHNQSPRAARLSFQKRKDCIKKKTMELSVLCDIKACTLITGPDGKMETWPEKPSEVQQVINMYKEYNAKNKVGGSSRNGVDQHDDDHNGILVDHVTENGSINGSWESLTNLLEQLDAKLDAVNEKIAYLNMINMQSAMHMGMSMCDHPYSYGPPLQHAMEPAIPLSAVPFWSYDPGFFFV